MGGVDQALAGLNTAYKLNPNTYDNSRADRVQYFLLSEAGSKDPKVVDTGRLKNELSRNSLASLKSTFPGAVSNDERKALEALSGAEAKSLEERKKIMEAAARAARAVRTRLAKRIEDINAGKFRTTTPEPTTGAE